MKEKLMLLGVLMLAWGLQAEMILNPEPGVLWIENGRKIQVSPDQWAGKWWNQHLTVQALEEQGGFKLAPIAGRKNQTMRYVPVDAGHPWLEFKVAQVSYQRGYVGMDIFFSDSGIRRLNQVSVLNTGIFAFRPYLSTPPTGKKALMIYLYGAEVSFDYIKGVQEPRNYVYAESPALQAKNSFAAGDTVKFTVKLAKSAEDVTVRLFDSYMMKPLALNSQDKIQLKPVNGNPQLWSAEVKIKTLTGGSRYKSVLMKAMVLGSDEVKDPLWGMAY